MTADTADYLTRLDAALRDVPHGIASDIRAGIEEELVGLSPVAAAARIAQLGDPAVIAREAMDAGGADRPVAAPVVAPKPAVTSTRGFAITAALALSFGGFVIPFVGWFVGAAMVIVCGLWRGWEKVIALLAPLVAAALVMLVTLPAYTVSGGTQVCEVGGDCSPAGENPLVPGMMGLNGWHLMIILAFVLVPASGLWLLWRLRGRTASAAS